MDTCMYDACQLLLGTLVFTVLSFLTPTISVYYTFFCIVQAVSVGGQVRPPPRCHLGRLPLKICRLVKRARLGERTERTDHSGEGTNLF